ncbi:putative mRna-decapping enzyme subunit 1 [Cardiosporidium cionae]|uniref:MRna-decapping enzyme subunit 1 n=1 Tax=Cardiosporidium cionae TaxID=476202 RepID=A0ABQ7JGJ8_9APIC|nr:putative mRna-decapping enzyme subunit 1 [Cardiosporidium cionae]|eukprot:KAF8823122.1 putative mRna-decapping enzyme subunit 1 [Cardiosporidium cionae]
MVKTMAGDTSMCLVSDPETQQARQELATRVLKNMDTFVDEILLQIPFAALYVADFPGRRWKRADIEGSLYCAKRRNSPKYRLFILNKLNQTNFVEDISERHEVDIHKNYVFIWSPVAASVSENEDYSVISTHDKSNSLANNSYAIWAYYKEKSLELCTLLQSFITELREESNEEIYAAHQQFSEIVKVFKAVQPYDCSDGVASSTEHRETVSDEHTVIVRSAPVHTAADNAPPLPFTVNQGPMLVPRSQSVNSRFAGQVIMKMLGVTEKREVPSSSIVQSLLERTPTKSKEPVHEQPRPTPPNNASAAPAVAAGIESRSGAQPNNFLEGMDNLAVSLKEPIINNEYSMFAPTREMDRLFDSTSPFISNESKHVSVESSSAAAVHSNSNAQSKLKPNLLKMLKESNVKSHDNGLDAASTDKRSSADSEIKDDLDSHLVDPMELLMNNKKSHNHVGKKQDENTNDSVVLSENLVECFCNAMGDVFQTKEFKNMLWDRLKLR